MIGTLKCNSSLNGGTMNVKDLVFSLNDIVPYESTMWESYKCWDILECHMEAKWET